MIKIYKTNIQTENLSTLKEIEPNCWIDLTNPTTEEIDKIVKNTQIDKDLILKMLDEEELPRIEVSGNATLVVIDTPFLSDSNHKNKYKTYPLGIIITENDYIITISMKQNSVLEEFRKDKVKTFATAKKTRFLIQILLKTASSYLKILTHINKDMEEKEKILSKSTQNKHLIGLLDTEKTLVYFMTSLKENDTVLDRLSKGNVLPLYEEDIDLLEDTVIEHKQAIEMSGIYRDILSSVTNTYATIVSNNLNIAMKFLAGITIVFSIPTMIASFMGMNVPLGRIGNYDFSFLIIAVLSFVLALVIAYWLKKKDML